MPQIDMPLDQLKTYTGSSPCPRDFDAYWARALEDLDALEPPVTEWREASFAVPFARCRDLYFTGVGGARIHARCVLPGDVDPRPLLLHFHGYTMRAADWSRLLAFAAAGFVIASMDVRGQGGESVDPGIAAIGAPPTPRGVPGPTQQGHVIRGMEGAPEHLFYRNVYLDTVQLARILGNRPEVDASRIGAFGASQGGALTLACAALEPRVSRVVAVYPFLSDFRRMWEMETGGSAYEEMRHYLKRRDPRHERIDAFFERLGYIDVQNLAPRITGEVMMMTGLMDELCPASTQFAAYNKLGGPRRLILYPDFGHEWLPDQDDLTLQYFLRHFSDTGGTVTQPAAAGR